MRKLYILLLALIFAFTACKKDLDSAPYPTADFKLFVTTVDQSAIVIPLNNSDAAESYLWDLGNGKTSTDKIPTISFDKLGDYDISLTVTNADGVTNTSAKKIKVVAPILSSITITDINKWAGFGSSTLKKFTGGDVWVEIKKSDRNRTYKWLADGSYDYPLFYKSAVLTSVSTNVTEPLTIPITDGVVLDKDPALGENYYSMNLYVKDNDGTHLLFTSELGSNNSISWVEENKFSWTSSINTTITVNGYYY